MDASMLFENDESDSEYAASDELFSESTSEDEAHVKYSEFNFSRDINDPIFKIGMVFANNHEFKEAWLLRTNPGNTVMFKKEKGKFQGVYICLAALKAAFKDGCRPLVCLDGYWLKGTYGASYVSGWD
ncbi:hypothetical protein GH714_030522 [Hevea brasiliensis]|uniref:Uncharacterized protein n=1 Tax=Hevea brasiliensis TaxID=3981 RepID=A0A6A6LVT8_HEVBR|nr:hypothetical protein GH714_030522 [Hevea brasiliensis]